MEYLGDYTVYMHVNKRNGLKYIGITKRDASKRWMDGKGYSVYTPFGKAVYELGFNMFDHVLLNSNISKELAEQLESFYIKYFMTNDPAYGYNIKMKEYLSLSSIKNAKEIIDDDIKRIYIDNVPVDFSNIKLINFIKDKKHICVCMIWKEFFNYDGKPKRASSEAIANILNKIDFLEKKKTAVRLPDYGSSKVWVNKLVAK